MNTLRARQQLCALLFIIVSLLALAAPSADAAVPPRPAQREYVVDAAHRAAGRIQRGCKK